MLGDRLARQQKQQASALPEPERAAAEAAIREFGTTFPKANVMVGESFHFAMVGKDVLRVSFQGKAIGEPITNAWIAQNLVAAYLEENPLVVEVGSAA